MATMQKLSDRTEYAIRRIDLSEEYFLRFCADPEVAQYMNDAEYKDPKKLILVGPFPKPWPRGVARWFRRLKAVGVTIILGRITSCAYSYDLFDAVLLGQEYPEAFAVRAAKANVTTNSVSTSNPQPLNIKIQNG